ncbi:DEAD/DEAH box helicase family protein [Corynebacterium sanguinis]|uniref:DEAD/DEAH box helicase family protein n=1 Tax=Corynebacterium sanguinis TaxID=2594913 RepID=UPI0036F1FA53
MGEADRRYAVNPATAIGRNIRALEELASISEDTDPTTLTDSQRGLLAQWQSWGALADVFDERDARYARERDYLHTLLSDSDYRRAERTVLSAFFTDEDLTRSIWSALESAGYKGGTVLEPGCGKGNFLSTAPEGTHAVGVELDPTTARIASLLHPDAQIRAEDFTHTDLPDDTFTATIGNVPFVDVVPYDPARNPHGLNLHNYVISKSIDLTKPGGYVAVISSTGTADAKGNTDGYGPRAALTDRADFITGVRLPSGKDGAFAANAGTQVATDVLVFRVREGNQEPTERTEDFLTTTEVEVDGQTFRMNTFFADHPENILGTPRATTGRFGAQLAYDPDTTTSLPEQVRTRLTADIEQAVADGYGLTADTTVAEAVNTTGLLDTARAEMESVVGTLRYEGEGKDLTFLQRQHTSAGTTEWVPVRHTKKYADQWVRLIDMRDTTTALLTACRDENTADIHALRATLNEQYDAYVEAHGPINLHEVQEPTKKSDAQIEKAFAKLDEEWRLENGLDDRPFEGDLPIEVYDELMDQARQTSSAPVIKRRHLEGAIASDPFMNAVYALERYNQDTKEATKGPLFTTNPIRTVVEPDHADTLIDALDIIEGSDNALTADNLADLLDGYDAPAVAEELQTQGLAFRDPLEPEEWIPRQRYLSGAVRTKLRVAEDLASTDERFVANREALRDVQPERITEGITMNLGATWIPNDVYVDFIAETLQIEDGKRDQIDVKNVADKWSVSLPKTWWNKSDADIRHGLAAANARGEYNFRSRNPQMQGLSHHGVAHRGYDSVVFPAAEALRHAMNSSAPRLNYSLEARVQLGVSNPENATVLYPEATQAAGRKAREMAEHFRQWTREDPARYERLIEAYNDQFNNVVAPVYDGSTREFPGMSEGYTPYPYQRNAVERMVHEPGVLLNHVVGAGKTGSMVMGAMELKRLGKVNKPALVVPNHLVEQIAREANQWYPGARVLSGASAIGGGKNGEGRQMFAAQAATNHWDLVVIPESVFTLMGLDPEIEADYLETKMAELRKDLQSLENAGPDHKRTIKDIQKTLQGMEHQHAKKREAAGTDVGITFDQTGIDYLIVDEAHGYKNLGRVSPLRELAHEGAAKSTDMDMKIDWLRGQKRAGAPVVTFATGTPITNSIAELWVMQHYLRPDLLQECDIAGVNAWGKNFTEAVTSLDFSAGGRIKERTRIAKYVNVREITQMNSPLMDYVDRSQIPAKLPQLDNGAPTVITFDPGDEVKDLSRDLMWREKQLPRVDARIDNPLKLINDGKSATLDPRLAGLDAEPGTGRLKAVADQITAEWEANRDNTYLTQFGEKSPNPGGLQIVFCDKGVPSSDPDKFTIYEALRQELVARGMEESRIRFIHEWDDRKLQLFDDCNNGKVDVVIGNTAKLSTGANIQTRAVALHHIDVPWRPADMEQRDGRIIRQGNQNQDVRVYHYIAAGTADGHAWSTLKYKQDFIQQIYQGRPGANELNVEDNEGDVLARNKSLATGNPDFEREIVLTREVEELQSRKTEHVAQKESAEFYLRYNQKELPRIEQQKETLKPLLPAAKKWLETDSAEKTWTFSGVTYTDRKEATEAMTEQLAAVSRDRSTEKRPIGEIGGVPLYAHYSYANSALFISSPAGQHPKSIPDNLIRDEQVRTAEEDANLPQSRAGFLTRMESSVNAVVSAYDRAEKEMERVRREIDRLENSDDLGDFPQQAELEEKSAELREVKNRIRDFNQSDGEKRAQLAYMTRLEEKGRSPGYSLELNPTRYMIEEGITYHPEGAPIVKVNGTAEEQAEAWDNSGGVAVLERPTTSSFNFDAPEQTSPTSGGSFLESFGVGIDKTSHEENRQDTTQQQRNFSESAQDRGDELE